MEVESFCIRVADASPNVALGETSGFLHVGSENRRVTAQEEALAVWPLTGRKGDTSVALSAQNRPEASNAMCNGQSDFITRITGFRRQKTIISHKSLQ